MVYPEELGMLRMVVYLEDLGMLEKEEECTLVLIDLLIGKKEVEKGRVWIVLILFLGKSLEEEMMKQQALY
ncbi:hypothetical protein AO9_02245 [Chlamydia psittaci Mat116]|nr:hypothetical protein AO9_02245 [Chlamydia psittaci Mat116]